MDILKKAKKRGLSEDFFLFKPEKILKENEEKGNHKGKSAFKQKIAC